MPRQPQFQLPMTDNVMVAILSGNDQTPQPVPYSVFKAAIVGQSQQVEDFLYVNADPENFASQVVTFAGTLSTANAIATFSLPNNVNYDPSSVVITTTGLTVNMIGGIGDGTEVVGYIVAIKST